MSEIEEESHGAETLDVLNELEAEFQAELRKRTTIIEPETPDEPNPDGDLLGSVLLSALLALLGVLAGSGIAIALGYAPTPEDATSSLAYLEQNPLGAWVRSAHWIAAQAAIALSALYLFRLAWGALYRGAGRGRWFRASLLLAFVALFFLSGQLLPYDQSAVAGTDVRMAYLQEIPFIGGILFDALGSAGSLLRVAFAGHVLVLPALVLLILRALWGDIRPTRTWTPMLVSAIIVGGVVLAGAAMMTAPLGLSHVEGESFDQARPEWWALGLYQLLQWLPSGVLATLGLVLPPALFGGLVVALPVLDAREPDRSKFKKPLRIALMVGALMVTGLSLTPIISDMQDDAGWFHQSDVEEVMELMDERNLALGNDAMELPDDAHRHARDLRLLADRLRGNYPDDLEEPDYAQWDQWCDELAGHADELWNAASAHDARDARSAIRGVCVDCHDDQGIEDVTLNPALPEALGLALTTKPDPDPDPIVTEPDDPDPTDPEPTPSARRLFSDAVLAQVQAAPFSDKNRRSTRRMMNQGKYRLRDLLRANGDIEGDTEYPPEQTLKTLLAAIEIYATMWEDNEATHPDKAQWAKFVKDLRSEADKLATATKGKSAREALDRVGKTCDACHDAGVDWDEPFEWRYSDLLE